MTGAVNRFLFVDRVSVAETALVLSLPSLLWRDFGSLTVPYGSNETHMNYISVIARLLCDHHQPYDVVILGYPRAGLFNETAQLSKLASGQYSQVIMPFVDSLSEAHVAALRSYASNTSNSLVVVAPEITATLTEELLPRAPQRTGPANVFAGVNYTSIPHQKVLTYYECSDEAVGSEMHQTIVAARERRPEIIVDGPESVWVGSIFGHGGSHADGIRSVSLVNYDLKLSPPAWYSLKPRNASDGCSATENAGVTCACGMCGEWQPAAGISVALRCPDGTCAGWKQQGRVARAFAPEHNATALPLDFTVTKGYATVTLPPIRSFAVVAVAPPDEIEARAAAAELRRWVNRAVTQAEGVTAAGEVVATTLRDLQQIHGPGSPLVPPGGFAAAAAKFGAQALSMKAAVQQKTLQLEQADAAVKGESQATAAILKLDAGAAQPAAGFHLLSANTSGTAPAATFGWLGNTAMIQTADCGANENKSTLFRTGLWSEKPAVLRIQLPSPGTYTITLWVGNCFTDQSGAFSPWTGYGHKGEYCTQGACEQMASKVAVASVSLVTKTAGGSSQPTLTPVLLGDRTASGFVGPRVFTHTATSTADQVIDMRLTGSTGTSFLNRIAWSLSALTVTTAQQPLGASAAKSLHEKEAVVDATVRDWFHIGPFDDLDATGLERVRAYEALDGNISKASISKFHQPVSWHRWEQPSQKVQAPSLPLAWLLAWGREGKTPNATEITVGSAVFATTGLHCGTTSGCTVTLAGSTSGLGACFLNGENVWKDVLVAGLIVSEVKATAHLRFGWNVVVVASFNNVVQELYDPNAWGLTLAVLDETGTDKAPGVTIDACSGGKAHATCNAAPVPTPAPPVPVPPPPPAPPPPPPAPTPTPDLPARGGPPGSWRYTVEASRLSNYNVMFDGHHDPTSTEFALNFGPSHVLMPGGVDALAIRVCREGTGCSTPKNPDMITFVKRIAKGRINLANLSSIREFQAQFQPNTEARIIKRPNGTAEQCGVQDPRIVYDPATKYFFLAYTAYGNPYQKAGQPLTCEQAFTRIIRSKTPETEASWEKFLTAGPTVNGSIWDYDAVSTAILVRPSPPHYAFIGRGPAAVSWQLPSLDVTTKPLVFENPKIFLQGRPGGFDSGYVEAGSPPALLSTGDYLHIYDTIINDGRVPKGGPSQLACVSGVCRGFGAGWAVLNGSDPQEILQRGQEPLFMPVMPWELGPRPEHPDWGWMQPTGFAIGATNGLMRVAEGPDHDTFIAWACASDSVITPWVVRVRRWVGGAFGS